MAYDTIESSRDDGRPYFLYQFVRGAITTRLAASEDNLIVGGFTWTASPIAHGVIEQNGDIERSSLELEFPLDDTFAFGLLVPNTQVMTITVFRIHYSDVAAEMRQYWKGRLVGATSGEHTIKVTTESVFSSLRRPGCRVRVQRSCRHDHYGAVGCTLSRAAYEVAMSVTAISGLTLTIPAAAGGGYTNKLGAGIVNWNGIFGQIDYHSGTSVVLVTEIPGLEEALAGGAQAVLVAPGCSRALTRCVEFNNYLNFGGFKWLPKQNPFSTSIA
jgi:Phage conserved hypothetical protein BR0599./Uncharacterized conserved protein (DUF2163).